MIQGRIDDWPLPLLSRCHVRGFDMDDSIMNEYLYSLLMAMPKKNLIVILWRALESMQGYNGQTKTKCIAEAMGAESKKLDKGRHSYNFGSKASIKEYTNDDPFL